MKYINLFMTVLYIVSCIFVISYFNKCEEFYKEFNDMAEILNNRINRILYVKVLQEGDTLWFISDDLEDTFWITNDTSWIFVDTSGADKLLRKEELSTTLKIEYDLEFFDSGGMDLIDDGVLGVAKDVPTYPELYLNRDIVIYPDQFSGNTYIINADGDTIFKYIKGENE